MSIRVFSVQPVAVPPVQTLNNGLSLTGTTGQLGGNPLIQNTTLNIGAFQFAVSGTKTFFGQDLAQMNMQSFTASFVFHSQLHLINANIDLSVNDNLGNTSGLEFSPASLVAQDQINNLGLIYLADYSAIGKTLPRWIPDYGAVTSAIAAAVPGVTANNGLTDTVVGLNHTIKLGGALTGNTTVTVQPAQTLLFVDSLGKSEILLSPNQVIIEGFNSFIQISNTSMTVNDGNNATGLTYTADYSAIGLTLNRWIPDLGGIKAYITSLQIPVTIGRNHSNGLAVGTFSLISYAVPAGTSVMFRVNGSYTFRTGAGTVAIQVIWTDTGATVNNKTPQTKSVVGADFWDLGGIYVNGGTTISINAVVTGTAIGDFSVTLEQLF